ncbi:fatty acid desaturase family protein [Sinorhizobium numidicum]|uniref:Fatty acid desaturase family protein n=1 Tax=Sinorhizobium numidicum TaxID=680248 RepID=A0ABY8D1G3_9HYPH|nr:fatty acid desaturase family protein [Sinorhizobium numidicum]WEX78079.1 fatty acid desaturase family protein [Sinorhizobium numidicum]WEX84738.1 fatty acid desaturase family protein [Sinorhizobium numidicum]
MSKRDRRIDPRELKRLSVLEPRKSLTAIASDWAIIAAAIAASEYAGHPIVYVIAVTLIAGRMHALGCLVHEAAHYRIIRDRKVSDWMGDVLLAWPILGTVDGYRQNHLAHHQHANTDHDPDWTSKVGMAQFTFPQKLARGITQLLGYLVAINSIRDLMHMARRIGKSDRSTRGYKALRLGFYLGATVVFTILGIWREFVIYWLVPYFTFFCLFLYVRSVAEHFGSMDYSDELTSSRTVYPHAWEKLFFAPHNINYHLEHHLYPGVPYYNLPELHAILMRNEAYAAKAHITRGYTTGLPAECFASNAPLLPSQHPASY